MQFGSSRLHCCPVCGGYSLTIQCPKRLPNENNPHPKLPDSKPSKQTRALGSDYARKAPRTACPHVVFVLCRVRLLDIDAKYGSIKDLLDGLQYAGLIHGDKEGEITLEVRQEKVKKYALERTIIGIDYPPSIDSTY